VFNTSTALLAAGLSWDVLRYGLDQRFGLEAALVLACAAYLFVSTVPVAVVLSLAEGKEAFGTWSEILHLSFPYYLASTGLASIAVGLGGHAYWPTLAGVACVSFVMYRSYRTYFTAMRKELLTQSSPLVKAAAAAQ